MPPTRVSVELYLETEIVARSRSEVRVALLRSGSKKSDREVLKDEFHRWLSWW